MKRLKGSELRKELIQTLSECVSSKDKYSRLRHFIYKYDSDGVVQMLLLMMENKFVNYCFQQKILELRKKNQITKLSSFRFKDKESVSKHYELVSQTEVYNVHENEEPEESDDVTGIDKELDCLLGIIKQIEEVQFQKERLLEVYREL